MNDHKSDGVSLRPLTRKELLVRNEGKARRIIELETENRQVIEFLRGIESAHRDEGRDRTADTIRKFLTALDAGEFKP